MADFISNKMNNYIGWNEKNMAIVIDGIIGAGKSSIGTFLSQALEMPIYQELKSDHQESLTQRMLDRFYEDQSRWSAIIQIMFLNDRFKDLTEIERCGNRAILDRSIYGDEIFARTIHERGQMTDDEFQVYLGLLKQMMQYIKRPQLLIYLDVTVDTAMARIAKRSRSTEGDLIARDYMEDLRKHYETWYEGYNLSPKIRIDLNDSAFDQEGQIREDFKEDLLRQIKEKYSL